MTADDAAYMRASTDVVSALRKVLRGATVEVERHAELATDASGKFRSVVALGSSES